MDSVTILYIVVIVVVIAGIVIWIASISRRAKRMSDASDARLASALADIANNPPATKPFAAETPAERSEQVIAMAEDDDESPAQVTATTKESRLAELADLHAKGSISDDELATARAKILAE